MEWQEYSLYDPGYGSTAPLKSLSPEVARAAFDKLMRERFYRIEELTSLARVNGVIVSVEGDGLDSLCEWFSTSVEEHPDCSGKLLGRWYSVASDISLLIGEIAIARTSGKIRWEFFIWGKRDVAYHRAVLMGSGIENEKMNIDVHRIVFGYAHGVVKGRNPDFNRFSRIVASAMKLAD